MTAKKKTAPKAEEPRRIVKAGGAKGEAIVQAMKSNPRATRRQIAELAGCTTGRVGEVVRYLAAHGSADEKKIVKPFVAGARDK